MPHSNSLQKTGFRIADPEFSKNPGEAFSRVLEFGPVFRGRVPIIGKVWFSTTWEAVSRTLRQPEHFVREPRHAGRRFYSWLQPLMPRTVNRLSRNMLTRDGEDHRRLRTLVDQAFQRQSVQKMEGRIEQILDEHLDRIDRQFRTGVNSVDFVESYSRPVPLAVICELLGLPASDRPKFMKWFSGMSQVRSAVDIFRMFPMMRKTMKYLEEQFNEVRKHPRPGLITSLVEAEAEGERLSKEELVSTAMLLLLAGHETTVHVINNGLLTLLQRPDARHRFLSHPELGDATVNEILRWCSVIQSTKPRFVAHDMAFFDQQLQRGQLIMPLIGCANFDPAEFDDPLSFRVDRHPNRHMTFGNGPHVCLGMKLATAEARLALRMAFERWPDLTADFDLAAPDFGKRLLMRTFKSLLLRPGR